jgi:hypothetical protein
LACLLVGIGGEVLPGRRPARGARGDEAQTAKIPGMRDFWPSLFLFALLCASAAAGFLASSRLPERHRSRDTIELMQLTITLLVTFTAIVLGLMTTSVKTGYDAAYNARGAYAGQLAELDRCLHNYGPETEPLRAALRGYVAAVIASTWPSEPPPSGVGHPDTAHMPLTGESSTLAALINEVGFEILSLQPADALHRNLQSACAGQYAELLRLRSTVIEGVRRSITTPFYWVLAFWLAILFASFGLRAPPNGMSLIAIGLCAISVAVAAFVIRDLDVPYGGYFGIPSTAMRNALADMMR